MRIILVLLAFTLPAFASTPVYKLNFEISLAGKPAASSKVWVKEGERATVSFEHEGQEKRVEVLAQRKTIEGRTGIGLDFEVFALDAKGQKNLIAQPRVMVLENSPATITSRATGASVDDFSLSVVVNRERL